MTIPEPTTSQKDQLIQQLKERIDRLENKNSMSEQRIEELEKEKVNNKKKFENAKLFLEKYKQLREDNEKLKREISNLRSAAEKEDTDDPFISLLHENELDYDEKASEKISEPTAKESVRTAKNCKITPSPKSNGKPKDQSVKLESTFDLKLAMKMSENGEEKVCFLLFYE